MMCLKTDCLLKIEGGDNLIDYALPWFGYRGFVSQPHYSEEDGVWYGKIDNISDLVVYDSDDISKLYTEFVKAVEDYVDFCKEVSR